MSAAAERAMASIERAHRLYTTGRTSHAQYVAAVAVGIAISKSDQTGCNIAGGNPTADVAAGEPPRQVEGFAKAWPIP